MGEIVAAIGTCHTPYMFTRPPDENPKQLEQAGRAMNELGKVLDETKPDVILFLGADHVETFSVSCVPTFCIVAGNTAHAKFAGPRAQAADSSRDGGRHPQQARHRAQLRHRVLRRRRARPRVLDSVRVRDRQAQHPGHSVLHQRLRSAAADRRSAARRSARRWRRSSRGARSASRSSRAAACRTSRARRSICIRNSTSIAGCVSQIEGGQHRRAAEHDAATQLDEVGNTEMLSWAVMFGAIGAQKGELIDYIPTWHHGLGMMRFSAASARTRMPTSTAKAGDWEFKNQGFLFYKHPPSEGYGLNKLLFESRHSQELRNRIVNDLDIGREGIQPARPAADRGRRDGQRRQRRPGQRARRSARRGRRASAAGADGAARDLLHQSRTRAAGHGGKALNSSRGQRS